MRSMLGVREHAILGGIAVVLVVAMTVVGFRWSTGALTDHLALSATFSRTGQGLDHYSDVRVRGVEVGSVTHIELDDQGQPVVHMELDPGTRVPQGAIAAVEATSIFGPKFVALDYDPGALDGPLLADGDRIERTRAPTELQDMLGTVSDLLTAVDPDEVGALVSTGARLAEEVQPRVGAMLQAARTLTDVASDHTDDGTALLADLRRLTDEVAGWGEQVARTGRDAHRVLPLLWEREDDLVATMDAVTLAAHAIGDVLERHPDAATTLIQGLLPALLPPLAAIAGNLRHLPVFAEVIAVFFGELASIMHVDGPDDGRLGAIELLFNGDLCEFVEGLQCHEGAR